MIVLLYLYTASRLYLLSQRIIVSDHFLRVKEETKPSCSRLSFSAGNQFTNADRNFYFFLQFQTAENWHVESSTMKE